MLYCHHSIVPLWFPTHSSSVEKLCNGSRRGPSPKLSRRQQFLTQVGTQGLLEANLKMGIPYAKNVGRMHPRECLKDDVAICRVVKVKAMIKP